MKEENKIYQPTKSEQETIDFIKDESEILKEYSTPIHNKRLRLYWLYKSYQSEAAYPWRNNICLPIAFSIVETVTPRLLLNPRKITLSAQNDDAKKKVDSSGRILDYDWSNEDFQLEVNDWIKRSPIYGTSVIGLHFSRIKTKVPAETFSSKLARFFRGKWKDETIEKIVASAYEPFRIQIDPDADLIKKARVLKVTTYLTEQEIKDNREGIYKNTEFVKGEEIHDDYIALKRYVNELTKTQRGRIVVDNSDESSWASSIQRIGKTRELVRVDSYWVRSSKKHPLGRLIVMANNEILLRDGDNPYWYVDGEFPFVEIKDHFDPGEFWAAGEIEPIEALIYEKNQIRNRRLDSSEQAGDKMWWVDPNSDNDMDENEFVWQPSGIIHGKFGIDFGTLESGGTGMTTFNEENLIKSDISETIGVTDYSKGVGQRYETATGMMALIAEANQRFALKVKLLGEMGISRLGKMILQIENFEMKKPRLVKILGKDGAEEFIKIKPSEISSDFEIKCQIDPSPIISKEMDIKQLTQVLTVVAGDPNIDKRPILKAILEKIDVLTKEELAKIFPETPTVEGAKEMIEGIARGRIPRKIPLSPPVRREMVGEGAGTAREIQPMSNEGVSVVPPPAKLPRKIRTE